VPAETRRSWAATRFAHEELASTRDGVLKERATYEDHGCDEPVGLRSNAISARQALPGANALSKALEEMGFELDGHAAEHGVQALQGAGRTAKKQVTAMDLEALVTE